MSERNLVASSTARSKGFTLLELLVVMTIIGAMVGLSVTAISSLSGSGSFDESAFKIAGVIDQARAHAMANNTYVYVGLHEVDGDDSTATTSGTGKVILMMAASIDGTRGFDSNTTGSGWDDPNGREPFGKLAILNNMHLADSSTLISTGEMLNRPSVGSASYHLADTDTTNRTLAWGTKYTFGQVLQVDPQGVVRLMGSASENSIPPIIEIGLQEAKGKAIPSDAQIGVIQISGISGSVRVYRP